MTIAKTIPKPRNWQDFERLCKKLFGELWRCPTTVKANGRAGQAQNGVDVYGVPDGKQRYWGVQCKGKDDDLASVLTIKEIDSEVAKAQNFRPALESFIIATTSPKDVALEEHVRLLDVSSRESGGFAIHLFCWEDLADLIESSRDTFTWWVREKRHKERFEIQIGFDGGSAITTIRPKFRRVTTDYILRSELSPLERNLRDLFHPHTAVLTGLARYNLTAYRTLSESWPRLGIIATNSGHEVIEDYRIALEFGTLDALNEDLEICNPDFNFLSSRHQSLYVDKQERTIHYEPFDGKPLTQGDSRYFNVALKPSPRSHVLLLGWRLFSRDFQHSGELTINVAPEIEDVHRKEVVKDAREVRRGEVTIEEVVTEQEQEQE